MTILKRNILQILKEHLQYLQDDFLKEIANYKLEESIRRTVHEALDSKVELIPIARRTKIIRKLYDFRPEESKLESILDPSPLHVVEMMISTTYIRIKIDFRRKKIYILGKDTMDELITGITRSLEPFPKLDSPKCPHYVNPISPEMHRYFGINKKIIGKINTYKKIQPNVMYILNLKQRFLDLQTSSIFPLYFLTLKLLGVLYNVDRSPK